MRNIYIESAFVGNLRLATQPLGESAEQFDSWRVIRCCLRSILVVYQARSMATKRTNIHKKTFLQFHA